MRTDSDLSQTKIASYEQQILNQKFELARLKKQLNIQELKLTLLHEICRVSTDTFEVDCLLDSYMEMIMKAIRVATGSLLLIDQKTGNFSFKWPRENTRRPSNRRALLPAGELLLWWPRVANLTLPPISIWILNGRRKGHFPLNRSSACP